MNFSRALRLAIGLAAIVVSSSPAWSQDTEPAPTLAVPEPSVGELLQRLEALESAAQDKNKKPAEWQDTSQEKWTIKWAGRAHADVVLVPSQDATSVAAMGSDEQNYWQFRRLRFEASGEGYGVFLWKSELEFAPLIPQDYVSTSGTLLAGKIPPFVNVRDIYLGVKELPIFGQIQFGNFKAPFSLDELASDSVTTFMERSLISTAFVPQRQLGVCAFNKSADEHVTWQYGWFFDDTPQAEKMRTNDKLGSQVVARTTWTPYYDEPSDGRYLLHSGVAVRYTDDCDNQVRFRSRPEINNGERSIDSGAFNSDWWEAVDIELAGVWGPLSIQSELVLTRANTLGGARLVDGSGANRIPTAGYRNFYGGYAYLSYFLTGESRPYNRSRALFDRVTPLENFWAVRGAGIGRGAWEAATRWSCLDVSGTDSTASGVQQDLTVGLNWYWNPQMRWMFEYIHSWSKYDKPLAATQGTLGQINMLGLRGQVDW